MAHLGRRSQGNPLAAEKAVELRPSPDLQKAKAASFLADG
jgi:hypothetical protein